MPDSHNLQAIVRGHVDTLYAVLQEEYPYVDCEALGRWCGLAPQWWRPEAGLSIREYLTLLRQLHVNEVPNISLRTASRSRIEHLGVMGYAILASPTLAQGLQLACHLAEKTSHYARVVVTNTPERAYLTFSVVPQGADFYQLLVENAMISMWRYIQMLLPAGLAACASHATLNFAAPAYHWQYQQLLGCKVEFNQSRATLAIPRQWLNISIQSFTPQAEQLFSGQVRRLVQIDGSDADVVAQVKRLLIEKPNLCRFSLELTAPLLSLSARTLRRYLSDAGSSFRRICIEVRMDLARDYLKNTPLTTQEIAYQLGYTQATNFFRAFRDYYGLTPEQMRQQAP
jgi:AraC-like DNA-binding protein